jgi:N-acetylglucosaminyl-diphospho-decaprenol L-rhamnosyltransferase
MSTALAPRIETSRHPENRRAGAALDVSVCIANWNCRDYLRACLASLRAESSNARLEIIVVDNASTDGAPDMVEQEFPEVMLIRNATNRGFSRANNQAAQVARGEYLFFLNNDTLIPPGTIAALLRYAQDHPDIGMIGPRLRDGDGNVQVSYRCQPTLASLLHRSLLFRWTGLFRNSYLKYRRQKFDPNQTREVEVLMGAALFTRRQSFQHWGGWDEDFTFGGEDLELSVRVNRLAPLVYHPAIEITHYGRVSTRQHVAFSSPQIAIGMAKYLRKAGYSGWARFAYKLAITLDAPFTILVKTLEAGLRKLRGKDKNARKSLLSARAAWHFLRGGLVEFWRT